MGAELGAIAGREIIYADSSADAPPFPEAQTKDLPDICLLPGSIDMHVHPTYYWEERDSATYTYEPEESLVYSPVMIGLLAAANLRQALLAGVTTARDTGSVDEIMFDVKRAIARGLIPGPKLYVAGRPIVPTGGHVHYLPGLANQADSPYGFRRAVRQELRAGAALIKLANNGSDLTQEELNAAVDEAHRHGKKVVCHTSKPPAQRMAIDAGIDTFEHGAPTEEEIDLAIERGSQRLLWFSPLHAPRGRRSKPIRRTQASPVARQSRSRPGRGRTARHKTACQRASVPLKSPAPPAAAKFELRSLLRTKTRRRAHDRHADPSPPGAGPWSHPGCTGLPRRAHRRRP